jgi:hypothetical protein
MKRIAIVALIIALFCSLAPVISSISVRAQGSDPSARIGLAHAAGVRVAACPLGVRIEWRTSFELDNLGFNIYRDENGARILVNPSIIAGSALRQGTPLDSGYEYQWFDAGGTVYSRYYLEEIRLNEPSISLGPFTSVWSASLPKTRQAELISEVAAHTNVSAQAEGPAGIFDRVASTPATIQDQWAIAAQPGLKIGIKQNGWYRISQPEMAAAGFDVSGDVRNLRLFVDGREVPIEASRGSGQLSAADFIEFYGTGLDTPTTDTHVYYLINGSQPGLRIAVFGELHTEAGSTPVPPLTILPARSTSNENRPVNLIRRRNHAIASPNSADGFLYEVQRKERFLYFSSLLNGSAENFFGDVIAAPITKTLNVNGLQTDSQASAQLRIGLQGASSQTHAVNIFLNDAMIGSLTFDPLAYSEQTFNIAPAQLREGGNDIKFVKTSVGDLVLFSCARLTFPRIYRAGSDTLSFTLRSTQSATIDGFTTTNLRVLDISDPNAPQEVHTISGTGASGYAITVLSAGAKSKVARTLLAQPVESFLHPASISFNQPSGLNQSNNAADLLIISHQSFMSLPNLAALVSQRQSQGFSVKLVDVEDVFDEFSYGSHTPQALIDFLSRAHSTWTKAPSYLLLLGDASYDPRNYSGAGNSDFVPTKLIDTGAAGTSSALETASDDALTDFDGDGIPEIAIGRLPVRTTAEASLVLSKLVNFSPGNVPQTAVMVADTQGSYYWNFEASNEQLINLLPANMQSNAQRVYRRLEPSDAATRADIINKFNQGAALVNYSGHGNVDVWTGAPIFNNSDAMALTNGNQLPLVVVMDCLNGYFVAPNLDCIGESLLKAPNGGSVASFVSSGLTIPDGQHAMGQRLFQLLYGAQPMALGDATRLAKLATTDLDVRRTWILLGDPTMKIR